MSDQNTLLESLLTLVTDPKMVAQTIRDLQVLIDDYNTIKRLTDSKMAEVEAKTAAVLALQETGRQKDEEREKLDQATKAEQQRWVERHAELDKREKDFNDEKLKHVDKVRGLDQYAEKVSQNDRVISEREALIAKRDAETAKINAEALELKKSYEDKIAQLKALAG